MENILLVINIILALILVSLILLQKSEGGALGIGVSQENFMLSRSAGGFMTKATAIVATLFIICSLPLIYGVYHLQGTAYLFYKIRGFHKIF